MSPEEIKALRSELGASHGELAKALKVDARTIVLWESGEEFPTKRYVVEMEKLRAQGPSAIAHAPRGKQKGVTGIARLADPKLWEIVAKLCAHPAFFDQVQKLAEGYDEPS